MKPSDQGTLALLRTAIVRGKVSKKNEDPQSYYERRQEALRNHKI